MLVFPISVLQGNVAAWDESPALQAGRAVMSIDRKRGGSVAQCLQPPNVFLLSKRLDAVLDLLEVITDALAAQIDLATETPGATEFESPTVIQ